jgi:hypothetical protein
LFRPAAPARPTRGAIFIGDSCDSNEFRRHFHRAVRGLAARPPLALKEHYHDVKMSMKSRSANSKIEGYDEMSFAQKMVAGDARRAEAAKEQPK